MTDEFDEHEHYVTAQPVIVEPPVLAAPTRTLLPLHDWNASRNARITHRMSPRPNGLACPVCGAELLDVQHPPAASDAGETSVERAGLPRPPEIGVTCHACGYQAHRVL
jgi:hypothetical protein